MQSFKNIFISNVNCVNAETPISISGLAEMPVHDVTLKNITISSEKSVVINKAENIIQENVNIRKL